MMPVLFKSEEDAYSRRVVVRQNTNYHCMKCKTTDKTLLDIDTSDEEYWGGIFCRDCINGFFDMLKEAQNDDHAL